MNQIDSKLKWFSEKKTELMDRKDSLEKDTLKFTEDFQGFMKENFGLEEGKEFHLADVILKARLL